MKKFFAVIIMLIFWVVMSVSFLLFNFKATFLNADYYKTQLIKNNTYEKTVVALSSSLDVSSMGIPVDLDLSSVFTAVWLQRESEKILDGTVGLLKEEAVISQLGQVTINFQEPRQNLNQILQDKISSLPVCTDEQTQSMMNLEEGTDNVLAQLECLPAGTSISELPLNEVIPEEMNLLSALELEAEELELWQNYLDTVHYVLGIINITIIIGFVLSVFFFMLLGLMFIRQIKSVLRWWGNALLIPGIIGLMTFLPAKLILKFQTSELILNLLNIPPQAQSFNILLSEVVYALVNSFINRMLIPIIACLSLGIILLIIAKFIKYKTPQQPVPQPKQVAA